MTSLLDNGLLWFGAGLSLAEILTGMALAPLGFEKGLLASLVGHVIGCFLLYLAGVIGGRERKSSMESVKSSFGQKGSLLFILLNILQLAGWTAIMIYDGAIATTGIYNLPIAFWSFVIGGLILVWIAIGLKNLGKLNTVAISALFILTIVLSFIIFKGDAPAVSNSSELSFGAAIELSIAMPLSWLPLISDYTKEAKEPVKASAVSAITYGAISFWMYAIGLGAAIFTGEYDIDQIILKAGIGVVGLIVIVFSTVTTTFLDAYSAGVSSESISGKFKTKKVALIVTVFGILCAALFPITNITDFLYFIGSVFAPMIAIQIADCFILKRNSISLNYDWMNLLLWFGGFVVYRILMQIDTPLGNTVPDMLITILASVILSKIFLKNKNPEAVKESA